MIQSLVGIVVFIIIAAVLSENKKGIHWKMVALGVVVQILLALVLLKLPFVSDVLLLLNQFVLMLEKATSAGASFMFGYLAGGEAPFEISNPGANFIVAFKVLPIVLVMSAITSMLFHLGLLQRVVKSLSFLLEKTLKISGVQGLSVGANIFLGIVEAPLFVKGYLKDMSRSTLFVLMTSGMATVAGTVMVLYASIIGGVIENAIGHILIASLISAPAAVLISHVMIPPTPKEDLKEAYIEVVRDTTSLMDALVKGVMDGIQMLLAVTCMIIVLFALVNLVDQFLAFLPNIGEENITITYLASLVFKPLVWLMGVSWDEASIAADLMATKTILNEFVSYQKLANLDVEALSERSKYIMIYAMCGFANFASIGLMSGSLGVLVPGRRAEVVALAPKSLLAGTLATMMTGAVIGIII